MAHIDKHTLIDAKVLKNVLHDRNLDDDVSCKFAYYYYLNIYLY